MLLAPGLTVAYHALVASFGHVWMAYYARRLPLPLFLLSISSNFALMVAEHVQPAVDVLVGGGGGADVTVPGAAWLQAHSTAIHVAAFVPLLAYCDLMRRQVDIVRAIAGLAAVVLSDFVGLTVVAHPPPAYDCVAMLEAFGGPGGWVIYLWYVRTYTCTHAT